MNLVVISSPDDLQNETCLVNALFEAGLNRFHLRKPFASTEVLNNYLLKLHPDYWNRVVIHYNFELLNKFPVAGFHFNQHNLEWIKYKGLVHKSYSAHSFEEIIWLNATKFNYIFLSPVFDSISKPGYTKQFTSGSICEFMKSGKARNSIVALGGIDEENMEEVKSMGFSGAALMGAIWTPLQNRESVNCIVDKFFKMKEVWQTNLMF
jgi:thiamine-phosphate pyrophosphorylase